jgi:protein-S-isoprenylcysteine O-methyltransferase Ste14
MSLKARLALRVPLVTALVAALIFLPAGSFRFWQGWVFVGIFVVFNAIFIAYFYRRDPALVERRLQNKEPRREQKRFKLVWVPLWVCTLILPGLDHRFGWSVELLGNVALWLSILAWAMVAVGWLLVFHVMQINSFASAIVQVEAGQRVITDGPYRVVRHPMYTGFMLMILATPLALGSYVALLPALLLIPVLVFRIRDEERVLRQELSGYAEYCERTRFRLIPSVF